MRTYYRYIELEKNIYRITSDEGVCMELFVGSKSALLFDTGYGFGNLNEFVRGLTDKPIIIVNSHAHVDHIGGNIQFEEPVYLHPMDFKLLEKHRAVPMLQKVINGAKVYKDWSYKGTKNILPESFNQDMYLHSEKRNYCSIHEGVIFDLGGIHLQVYEVPGHTKGSIALYYKEKEWIYLADSINPFILLCFPESESISVYKQSILKMKNLNPKMLYIGHDTNGLTPDNLDLFYQCALDVDYEHGEPFFIDLEASAHGRICTIQGRTMADMGKPGFAAVVIAKDKLH